MNEDCHYFRSDVFAVTAPIWLAYLVSTAKCSVPKMNLQMKFNLGSLRLLGQFLRVRSGRLLWFALIFKTKVKFLIYTRWLVCNLTSSMNTIRWVIPGQTVWNSWMGFGRSNHRMVGNTKLVAAVIDAVTCDNFTYTISICFLSLIHFWRFLCFPI